MYTPTLTLEFKDLLQLRVHYTFSIHYNQENPFFKILPSLLILF